MKIAHVLTRFSPQENPGGVERVVEELALRQAENHDVEIICRNQFNDEPKETYKGINVNRAATSDISGLRTVLSLFSMRKLIKKSDADVFHVHDWSPYLHYLFAGEPKKAIYTMHNLSEGIGEYFEKLSCKSAKISTCVSSWLSDEILQRHGVETETVRNGVDIERFSNEDSEDFALYVGNISHRKGVEELNSVFCEKSKKIKYVGKKEIEVSKTSNQEFLGRISDGELESLYSRCDYLVLPSKKEGFGLVWAEALASGKPVVFTETGIGAEIPAYCGEKLSVDFTERDLSQAVDDIENREFDSSRLQKFAEDNFDWRHITEKYEALYETI